MREEVGPLTEGLDEGLWREGDYWALRHGGGELRVKHSKGLAYLAGLLEHPSREFHVLELAGLAEGGGSVVEGAVPALDDQAKREYAARIGELEDEFEEARAWNDSERAAKAEEELEFLAAELARSVGLGGRDRQQASQAERARQNVGRAIRRAVGHIGEISPPLGAHLERAIRTGAFCSYRPEPERPFPLLAGPPPPALGVPRPPVAGRRHNLPVQLTSFVGRRAELAEVPALLERHRLVTLAGVGGSGKTRLALEVAVDLVDRFREGVWLVDLAPIFDPELVVKAVAHALDVHERPSSALFDDVVERLHDGESLLIFDNCEHLVEPSATLVDELVRACPRLRILATSREPLAVPGEAIFRTEPLALPGDDDQPDEIAATDAVVLFRDRAMAAAAGFELIPDTAPLVAQICRRVDGVPLALELAAARVGSLSLHDVASNLDDCFSLLTGGTRTGLPRHRTLAATVTWSYDLLSEPERELLNRLSVFAGGFGAQAARQVCADAGIEARRVLDDLAALTQKSLVVRDELPRGRVRYRLLETLRQYGRERLEESGEAARTRDAHLDWTVALAEEAEQHLDGTDQSAWLDTLEAEIDNLRAALDWALASGSVERGLRVASIAMGSFWLWRSHLPEGQRWLARLLDASAPVDQAVRAKGLMAAGRLDFQAGDWDRGVRHCRECEQLFRAAGDSAGHARALIWLAINLWGLGDAGEVDAAAEAAIDAARSSGGPVEQMLALGLAGLWFSQTDQDRALALVEEGNAALTQAPSPNWNAHGAEFEAAVRYMRGDHDRARELLAAALPLYLQVANRGCLAHCFETIGAVAASTGQPDRGAELLGAAETVREQLGVAHPAYEQMVRDRGLTDLRTKLDSNSLDAAWQRGRALTLEQATDQARQVIASQTG